MARFIPHPWVSTYPFPHGAHLQSLHTEINSPWLEPVTRQV